MTFSPETLAALGAKLSSEHIKTRKQGGTTVSYIEGWRAEEEANRIFGFDGWESELLRSQEVCRYEVTIGKGGKYERQGWKVGYEAVVRVTAGGVFRDGIGHGSASMVDVFDCIESAAKEAATDAEKRALKTFGNPFGLALYDKEQKNVERNGGMTAEADQTMADNIAKVFDKPALIPVPNVDDEAARWKQWAASFIHHLDRSRTPDEVDLWVAKNGVPLGTLGAFSEKAYDHIQNQAEAKKAKLLEDAGLGNTVLGAG